MDLLLSSAIFGAILVIALVALTAGRRKSEIARTHALLERIRNEAQAAKKTI